MDVAKRLGLTDYGNLFDKIATILIAIPYFMTGGFSFLAAAAGILMLPMIPAFLTFPSGPLFIGVVYSISGLGVLYFYVLAYNI